MSHLVAHGHALTARGKEEAEQSLGSIFLNDGGGITVTVESPNGLAAEDTVITFPAQAVEGAVRRRIRGR